MFIQINLSQHVNKKTQPGTTSETIAKFLLQIRYWSARVITPAKTAHNKIGSYTCPVGTYCLANKLLTKERIKIPDFPYKENAVVTLVKLPLATTRAPAKATGEGSHF